MRFSEKTIRLPFVNISLYWGKNYDKCPTALIIVRPQAIKWPSVGGRWLN